MVKPFSILVQKGNDGVIDLLQEFSVACMTFPFQIGGETKDVETRDWDGEDGEDAYIPPSGLPIKAYDIDAEFCYKGALNSALTRITALRDYLSGADGDGAELKIYCPHNGIGRQGCYLKGFSDPEFYKSNIDEALSFKLKFRVTDPTTQINPVYSLEYPYSIIALA